MLALTRAFSRGNANWCTLSAAWLLRGVSKPGTLMHLDIPLQRNSRREGAAHAFPTLPKAGQGLAGAGGKQAKGEQRDVPAAAVRNEVTSEHINGVA